MQEDGLDIFQILEDLLSNKFKIILSTIFMFIIGYIYDYQKVSSIDIYLPINKISESEESKLSSINLLDSYNNETGVNKIIPFGKNRVTIDTTGNRIEYEPYITTDKLINEFYNEFNNLEVLKKTILKNNNSLSDTELIQEVNKIKLNKEVLSDTLELYYFTISSNESSLNNDINILINLLEELNNKVRKNIIEEIYNIKKSIVFSENIKLNFLKSKIANYLDNYKKEIRNKIDNFGYLVYLRNNFDMDVDKELEKILKDPNLVNFTDILFDVYKSKEKFDRSKLKSIIDKILIDADQINTIELNYLKKELIAMNNLDFEDIINESILNSGLSSDNFKIIQFDFSQMSTKKVNNSVLENIFIYPIFGFLFSSLSILIYLGYKRNRESFLRNK